MEEPMDNDCESIRRCGGVVGEEKEKSRQGRFPNEND